jgi:hypothetical protein
VSDYVSGLWNCMQSDMRRQGAPEMLPDSDERANRDAFSDDYYGQPDRGVLVWEGPSDG